MQHAPTKSSVRVINCTETMIHGAKNKGGAAIFVQHSAYIQEIRPYNRTLVLIRSGGLFGSSFEFRLSDQGSTPSLCSTLCFLPL